MSLCSTGNFFAEVMSQSRVPVTGLHWCWPCWVTQNPTPEVEASQDILLYPTLPSCPHSRHGRELWSSCGVAHHITKVCVHLPALGCVVRSLYSFERLVWFLVQTSEIFMSFSVEWGWGWLQLCSDAGGYHFWAVASLASGQRGPRGPDL